MKKCSTCEEEKSLDEFYRNRTRKDGRNSICKACDRAKQKARWAAHGGKSRVPVTHGSSTRYEKGCRCDECREAKRLENQKYRQRRKERLGIVTYDTCRDCGKTVSPKTNPDVRCVPCLNAWKSRRSSRIAKRERLMNRTPPHVQGTGTWYVNSAGVASNTIVKSITKAFNAGDYDLTLRLIKERSAVTDECWTWQGRSKNGYALQSGNSVHRMAWQASNSTILVRNQPVHHKCANSMCVNPEHLQVVTVQENSAEMLERRWYKERIKNLEEALRFFDPNNELLDEVEWI